MNIRDYTREDEGDPVLPNIIEQRLIDNLYQRMFLTDVGGDAD